MTRTPSRFAGRSCAWPCQSPVSLPGRASAAHQPRSCTGHPSCWLIGQRSLGPPLQRKGCVLKRTAQPTLAASKSTRDWKMKHGCQQMAFLADLQPGSSECHCRWLCRNPESPCLGSFVWHALTSSIGSAAGDVFLAGSTAASCCSSSQFLPACSPGEMVAVHGLHPLLRLRLGS